MDLKKCIFDLLKKVKPALKTIELESKLVSDLGFESIDIIDLFFEIQSATNIEIDLNEIADRIGGSEGRRFNDIKVKDIVEHLESRQ